MANKNRGNNVRTIPRRIDVALDDIISNIAKQNELSFRQASKELANITNNRLKGSTIKRDIIF